MKRTDLVPIYGDPGVTKGGVTSHGHQAVLEEHLPTILDADSIVMQGGTVIHRANIIKALQGLQH
jgi:hypothetical protein